MPDDDSRAGRSDVPWAAHRSGALAMALILAACGGVTGKEKTGERPPPEAGFVVLRSERVPLVVELPGRTAAYESSEVRPQVSGVIQARLFAEGTVVRRGQTLYRIDPSLYRASVAQARANLANAEAIRAGAQARADRFKPLAAIEAVSKQDYTDALATANQATASVAQNRALVDTASINLRFTEVPAPITGRIGRSLVTTGALVTSGQTTPLATIQRLDPMFVDIQQSSGDLLALRRALSGDGLVRSSATVTLSLEDGSDYPEKGEVEFAEPIVDPATGTVTLRARFPNPRGLLLPGMYVRAHFSQATQTNAILAPQAGVARDPVGNATALVVGPDNKATLRRIRTSRTIGGAWLVTAGLRAGDRLIVEGLSKITPGQTVVPVPAGSKPARRRPAPEARPA